MFCTKCGNELEEGIVFCSKCGNMIVLPEKDGSMEMTQDVSQDSNETVDLTKSVSGVQPEQQESAAPQSPFYYSQMAQTQAPQPENEAPQSPFYYNQMAQTQGEQYSQPQYSQPQYSQPQYSQPQYSQAPMGTPMRPKKKKAPLIIAIAAVLVIALGVVGLLMKPTLEMMINPEKQVKTALKQSTGKLADTFDEVLSQQSLATSAVSIGKMDFTYSLRLDKATVAGSDFLSYLKVDTLNAHLQMSPDDKVIAGTMGLAANGSTSSVIEAKIYMDRYNVYMSVPSLCSKSFYMSTDSVFDDAGIDYDQLFAYMGSGTSNNSMSMYSGTIQAVVKDVFAAVDTLIEEATYTKLGKVTLSGNQGNVKATQFAVTVTEQNVKNFANNVIDNIYNDDSLKALLGLVSGQINKDMIKKQISASTLGFGQLTVNVCVNNKKELVAFSFNTSSISNYKGDNVQFDVKFVGKEDIYDCVGINISADDFTGNVMISQNGNNARVEMGMKPLSSKYQGQYLDMVIDATENGTDNLNGNLTINQFTIKGNIDNQSIDMAMSGSMGYKQINSVEMSKSDFPNAINAERMTNAQQSEVAAETIKNISVLKNVLSDEMYNKMYKSMFGSSSSIGMY
ncbi:MAG: zinc-ribbon domain-containing protein [Clostridia bacterium]|nr:zinc-ribbon domain-containing protein [Clostridia bacterium]